MARCKRLLMIGIDGVIGRGPSNCTLGQLFLNSCIRFLVGLALRLGLGVGSRCRQSSVGNGKSFKVGVRDVLAFDELPLARFDGDV